MAKLSKQNFLPNLYQENSLFPVQLKEYFRKRHVIYSNIKRVIYIEVAFQKLKDQEISTNFNPALILKTCLGLACDTPYTMYFVLLEVLYIKCIFRLLVNLHQFKVLEWREFSCESSCLHHGPCPSNTVRTHLFLKFGFVLLGWYFVW